MSRIRVAIQKSGRLSEKSLGLLQSCGLRFARSKDKLFWYGQDFPVDLLLVRDDDIPRLLLEGAPPEPGLRRTAATWVGYLVIFVLLALVLGFWLFRKLRRREAPEEMPAPAVRKPRIRPHDQTLHGQLF